MLSLQRTLGNRAATRHLQGTRRTASPLTPLPLHTNRSHTAIIRPDQAILQRKKTIKAPAEIDAPSIATAQQWAAKTLLGVEAIRALQGALAVPVTGLYDEATIKAVYAQQRAAHPNGKIHNPGQAEPEFFARLGLISTGTIVAASVDDATLAQIKERFPDGVTVAIYSLYDYGTKKTRHNNAEFVNQATVFAANQQAVGLAKDGSIAIGIPVPIQELGKVIEVVQSIHRGLSEHAASLSQPDKTQPEKPTAFTQIKNLALFAHGEPYGLGLNKKNQFLSKGGGLHSRSDPVYPSNVKAFVQGLSGAITPDIRVQLFACSAARDDDKKKESYADWEAHTQNERKGGISFAAELATELGSNASVYGHTTAGHTTENAAARVFGKDSGAGTGGLQMFDLLYDDAFIQAELRRLFPDKADERHAALHKGLREQMWLHYKDSVVAEHKRGGYKTVTDPATKKTKKVRVPKRYPAGTLPLGQEMFINPENAKRLLRADWATWITSRIELVNPRPKPKAAKKPAKK
jgi:hypothetical protein